MTKFETIIIIIIIIVVIIVVVVVVVIYEIQFRLSLFNVQVLIISTSPFAVPVSTK
uniref:Uncharacterized protein n=1 Tax=Octopus bimaculoides TaxID=37653 RepID=A0A0L8HIW0_OCTBM